ncbi:MAG: tRNA (N6-threonylcarbamoyladenosine(37)-N6)-methyltransferase TrmO [Anaerolineaceae bacterium]|nr:tRNA (N6-threonylcarbamoyladenosine(37)-N6)-methyltransferase TrmO [Anaerolineaceae bacterium]
MEIKLKPIGFIHSPYTELHDMPIQPSSAHGAKGHVEVYEEYLPALSDLEGFSHIYLLYYFHLTKSVRLKVIPFLDNQERGLFSTRAPNRPNPIGLSVVKLTRVEDNILHVENIDVINGTPVLDIKPYVHEMEAVKNLRIGWLEKYRSKIPSQLSDKRFK